MKKTGMKKVLVIGATGFLGSKLMECFGKAFSVIGTHYGPPGPNTIALDITDAAQVQQVFAQTDPDIVILTSALTDVDLCERDQSLAWSTNVQGVANIAAHCEHRMLIFYSTDAVFDGNRGNYAEHDRPNPINYYGRTKMEAEGIVQKIPHHLILRSYLIYGEQDSPRFVNRVIRELREGHTVQAVTDADGTPTFIEDIADATLQLVQREKTGLYHVAGSTVLSFYDMAMTIAEVFGFSKKLILPIKNAELQRSAKRPVHASLNIEKVSREGIRMSTFREGIEKIATRVGATQYRTLQACRICRGTDLITYLNLGNIPLVNRYVSPDHPTEDLKFPLQIQYCKNCSLSQLSIVVNPRLLYESYFYRSSISLTFLRHCAQFALDSVQRFGLHEGELIVDIASNDGCALREFKSQGLRVLGVEPAQNLAALAEQEGVPTVAAFWTVTTAKQIQASHGSARMITAMNVFAHVDDLDDFLDGVCALLADDGIFAIEVPYLLNFVNKTEFDTSYHEHLSYFLLKPLIPLFARHGLELFDVKKFTIHGGSIRVYAKKVTNRSIKADHEALQWLLELEHDLGLYDAKTYRGFARDVERLKRDLLVLLTKLRQQGKSIAAYGASAKGNVLTNYCGIGREIIHYVVDDTPEKQGYLTPGNHIPIVSMQRLRTEKPDYLLLLAWNFAEELMEKTEEYRKAGGKYIIPIPNVRVV